MVRLDAPVSAGTDKLERCSLRRVVEFGPGVGQLRKGFGSDGFVSPVRIISEVEAGRHRLALENAEAEVGPLHYQYKMHTVLTSPLELAMHPTMLDTVEELLGPDILLYNVCYIVKEPGTSAHVAWHQDLTYWGFDSDGQVSAWLALSPATAESGAMMMLPGSHTNGRLDHKVGTDGSNVLDNDQYVAGVDETDVVLCPLRPGEASFHHGWTLHASRPNASGDRRIGLNIQYLHPSVRQTLHDMDTAMLVRGEDAYGNFGTDVPAMGNLEPWAMEQRAKRETLVKGTYVSTLEAT